VLVRPNDEPAGMSTVCPGRHETAGGPVVWWDPGALALGAKPPFGVRREELIVKDVPRDVIADGRSRYDTWRLARADARAAGAEPSVRAQTVREWAAREGEEDQAEGAAAVQVVRLPAVERPSGTAFGLLVHGVLAQASFDATRDELDSLAAIEARLLGLTSSDAAAASETAERILTHDLWRRARASAARGACRRESGVSLLLDDGTLVEGTIDLAFEENGAWTVVDYKTDRDAAAGEVRYRRQVALYAAAIAQATGAPANAVLVMM
jgi:ATP-dependent exoDNAse (exonuclease V) beta subunit